MSGSSAYLRHSAFPQVGGGTDDPSKSITITYGALCPVRDSNRALNVPLPGSGPHDGAMTLHRTGRGHHEAGDRHRMAAGDRGRRRAAAGYRLGRGGGRERLRGHCRVPESPAERGARSYRTGSRSASGGAARPDPGRLAPLAARAEALGAPLVTEHIAFVRAGGLTARRPGGRASAAGAADPGRTGRALRERTDRAGRAARPAGLENIAPLIAWPDEELTEGEFLAELVERTGVRLLIDVANLHTTTSTAARIRRPRSTGCRWRLAYVHVAGGIERDGVWHDTHAHPVTRPSSTCWPNSPRVVPPGSCWSATTTSRRPAELAGN